MNTALARDRRPFFGALLARLRVIVDAPARDSGAALLTTMLFMIMLAGLSLVMLSVLLGQIQPALSAQQSTRSVYSAQAGLQSALCVIRTAAGTPDAAGIAYGNRGKLPCTVAGAADGVDPTLAYQVTVRYYGLDPTGRTPAWLAANVIPCSLASGVSAQPRYAIVTARGAHADAGGTLLPAGDRTISAMYQFNITNVNIPGGMMFSRTSTHCIRAVTATAGSKVQYQPAANCDRDALELWIYDKDWGLKLASTTVAGATQMCITGPIPGNGNNGNGNGNNALTTQDVTLQPCRAKLNAADPARWNQLFSWEGGEVIRGQQQTIANGVSNFCLGPESTNLTGTDLQIKANGCGSPNNWTPEAAVGPGAASFATQQIVNFREFGRCTDVTNEQPDSTFLIVYPCKQDPRGTGAGILWNHKFIYTEPGNLQGSSTGQVHILVNNQAAQKRCLITPAANAIPANPRFTGNGGCNSNANQQWTRVAQADTYANSWLFVDHLGRCMTADPTIRFATDFSRITVAPCNGTEAQKWNAPPSSANATFGGFREVVG